MGNLLIIINCHNNIFLQFFAWLVGPNFFAKVHSARCVQVFADHQICKVNSYKEIKWFQNILSFGLLSKQMMLLLGLLLLLEEILILVLTACLKLSLEILTRHMLLKVIQFSRCQIIIILHLIQMSRSHKLINNLRIWHIFINFLPFLIRFMLTNILFYVWLFLIFWL